MEPAHNKIKQPPKTGEQSRNLHLRLAILKLEYDKVTPKRNLLLMTDSTMGRITMLQTLDYYGTLSSPDTRAGSSVELKGQ